MGKRTAQKDTIIDITSDSQVNSNFPNRWSPAGVEKSRTTSYHAMGNGMVERFNHTLLNMLGMLEDHKKEDWKSYIAPLVHSYNATRHDSTGYSPYFLMFGRHPRLAVDAYLGLNNPESSSISSKGHYAAKLKKRPEFAYQVASKEAEKMLPVANYTMT